MRIVSLCPSLTELVCDLGCAANLVGITEYCVHPRAEVSRIEKIGGTKTPHVQRIIELSPDLVLMNEEENRREDAALLQEAGIRCLTTFPRDSWSAAIMVRTIGTALNQQTRAAGIALDIETRAQRVQRVAQGARPVRFAYLIWRKPWMTLNSDTFIHGLLAQAGGENVFGQHHERYPQIELHELADAAPEIVFLGTEPFPFQPKHITELATLLNWSPDRLRIADGEYLSWHGSRTPAGIDYAERLVQQAREGKAGGPDDQRGPVGPRSAVK